MKDKLFERKLAKIKKRGERWKKEKELRDTYAEYMPGRHKKKVSNIMLVVIVIAVVGYTIAAFVLQHATGVEISPTLTTLWFSFWTAEIVVLAGIKMSKTKHKSNEDDIQEDCFGMNDTDI